MRSRVGIQRDHSRRRIILHRFAEKAFGGCHVAFLAVDPSTLSGKARVGFRSGFLGVATLGRSTLVQIVEASDTDHRKAIE